MGKTKKGQSKGLTKSKSHPRLKVLEARSIFLSKRLRTS